MSEQVLIAGAGPTGLVMALWLAKAGARFRIVDRNAGPGQASRAMAVQARTLELYQQLGIAQRLVAAGIKMQRLNFRAAKHDETTIEFGNFGKGLSPFPFVLSYPQDDHERLLVEELKKLHVDVEWNAELTGFEQRGDEVLASLKKGAATEQCTAAYLCGCDGAHSVVRQGLGLGFPGGTYDELFFVSDVEGSGAAVNNDVNFCLGEDSLYAVFPVRRSGMARVIGIVPRALRHNENIRFDDVRASLEENVPLKVGRVNWFSTYHVHHRVTDRFMVGRAFVVGDAAHVHSPAGGQGMNTGIGDAVNLAWKLAAVVRGEAGAAILETYETERIGFARTLVASTDRAFQAMVGKGVVADFFRTMLLPHLLPMVMGFSAVKRAQFRLVSQTRIHYPDSALSAGQVGRVEGGDRLPWVEELHNFDPLESLQWQIHVYGSAGDPVRWLAERRRISLNEFPFVDACDESGLTRNAFYLVRPDGYVAVAGETDVSKAEEILSRFEIEPGADAPRGIR